VFVSIQSQSSRLNDQASSYFVDKLRLRTSQHVDKLSFRTSLLVADAILSESSRIMTKHSVFLLIIKFQNFPKDF
jgi:hypothetical protein